MLTIKKQLILSSQSPTNAILLITKWTF